MLYNRSIPLGDFLSSFDCILCKKPVKQVSINEDGDKISIVGNKLQISCDELYCDYQEAVIPSVPPKVFHYSRRIIQYELDLSWPVYLGSIFSHRDQSKSFWLELNCDKCNRFSLGCVLDYSHNNHHHINNGEPFLGAAIQDQQISFDEFFVKNYSENTEYSVVTIKKKPSSPIKISKVDFNQSEKDILNDVKIQLAFM